MSDYTYSMFAGGTGGSIARRLGVPCDKATTWRAYAARFQRYAGDSKRYAQIKLEARTLSTGETAVACALLHAVDYSSLADELDGGQMWRRLDRTHGDHRRAVVAALLRQDDAEEAVRG